MPPLLRLKPDQILNGAHGFANWASPHVLRGLQTGVQRVHHGGHDADVFGHHVLDFDDHELYLGQHVQKHAENVLNAARQIDSKIVHKLADIVQTGRQAANAACYSRHQIIGRFHQNRHVAGLHGVDALLKIGFSVVPEKRCKHHVIGAAFIQRPIVFNVLNENKERYAKVQTHVICYN